MNRNSNPKSQVSKTELTILKTLQQRKTQSLEQDALELADLASSSGIRDNDEVLRALYTLEGKSLVQPEPPGDLTSHIWKITDVGTRALQVLN